MEPAGTRTHNILLCPVCCILLITNVCLKSVSQKYGQDLISHAWALITWDEASSHVYACLPGSKHLEEALNEALKLRPIGFLAHALYRPLGCIARISQQTLGIHSTCLTQAFRIEKMHLNSFLLFLKET